MKISCKSCGANLTFIPSKQIVCCEHCGNTYKPEEIEYDETIFDKYKEYTCSSCGAKLISFEKTGITSCVYCQGKEFVVGKINKEYILTGIIPFRLDKEQFIKNYEEQIEKLPDVERGFKESLKNAKIQGMYLPYSFANSFYRRQYGEVLFILLEEVIPYKFEEVKDFNPIYLDGLMADTITVKKEDNFIETNDASFYWVPVWVAEIEYQNDIYYIVANGQTWELAGMYKIARKKFRIPNNQIMFQTKLSNIYEREELKKQKSKEVDESSSKKLDIISSNEALKEEKKKLEEMISKEKNENLKRENEYSALLFAICITALIVFISLNLENEKMLCFYILATFIIFIFLGFKIKSYFKKKNAIIATYDRKLSEINHEIRNNEFYEFEIGKKTNSNIVNKILKLPDDKVYKDIRSVYFFTKKYSLKEKNNMQL